MENTMLRAHREFMDGLRKSLDIMDKDITEASEMSNICTNEWCNATEGVIDELHKCVYSISEPRWLTKEDSLAIRNLRNRIKDLYLKYKSVRMKKAA